MDPPRCFKKVALKMIPVLIWMTTYGRGGGGGGGGGGVLVISYVVVVSLLLLFFKYMLLNIKIHKQVLCEIRYYGCCNTIYDDHA